MIYDCSESGETQKMYKRLEFLVLHAKTIEVKEVREKRTLNQNSYLHLLLAYFGLNFGYTKEEAKKMFKEEINKELFRYEKKGREFFRSSSDLDTKEMTIAIERFRNLSANQGCYLPSADEKEYIMSVQRELLTNDAQTYL